MTSKNTIKVTVETSILTVTVENTVETAVIQTETNS